MLALPTPGPAYFPEKQRAVTTAGFSSGASRGPPAGTGYSPAGDMPVGLGLLLPEGQIPFTGLYQKPFGPPNETTYGDACCAPGL
jgi:hypothetical protein